MKLSKFSSDLTSKWSVGPKWSEALTRLMRPNFTPEQWKDFAGRVMSCETPLGIRLALIQGTPQQMTFLLSGEPDGVWLAQILEGRSLLIDGAKHHVLGPGDIAHGPVRGSAVLRFADPFKILFMRLPSVALNTRFAHAPQATCMNTRTGIGRILAAILKTVADTIEDVPDDHERVIESLLREFIVVNLMHSTSASSVGGLVGVQAALLQKAYQIIDARLSDPDLSMRKVSTELKISLRYLYKLFASSGEGFGRYIKRRRLERCRCDLSNPVYAHFNVSEICFRWGFNEAAHFSRAFRDQYGVSPRSWRKQAHAKRLADMAAHRPSDILAMEAPVRRLGENPLSIPAE